ncbi:hypothetical protein BDN70DRAFT_857796 [Pholiota conissans]|uniref:Uncharacterized protein n=1 Tax=Pholiota conissans TaxID=109636 RepID=A0A9P5Z2C1_9AGAR|nr:hypothetical protein BDN70DRAFT_857796 [Pholiota conissans]
MSDQGLKRKYGPVDLGKVRVALDAFKTEMDGIRGAAEEELGSISEHILALEDILDYAKEPTRFTFSTVRLEDLEKAGVVRKYLFIQSTKVAELAKSLTANAEAVVLDLYSRIKKIYSYVNMDHVSGPRMILDAILLGVAEMASDEQRHVAILPGMTIPGEVYISHPTSGYELCVSGGNLDYAVVEYKNIWDNKARLLTPGGSDVMRVILTRPNSWLFLVQAKYQSLDRSFLDYVPEALSQAIAMLEQANLQKARFCLSDGQHWLFFILQLENGTFVYYESARWYLNRNRVESSDKELREIVVLLCEWLRPAANDLFTLQ